MRYFVRSAVFVCISFGVRLPRLTFLSMLIIPDLAYSVFDEMPYQKLAIYSNKLAMILIFLFTAIILLQSWHICPYH